VASLTCLPSGGHPQHNWSHLRPNTGKIWITYTDESGKHTERRVWRISLTFFERVRLLAAWCELRQGFRHFRTDRMIALVKTTERLPRPRRSLLRERRQAEGLPDPD